MGTASRQPHSARWDGMEHAESNRNLSVGIGGTCVAILTFVLFFLYTGTEAHQYDPTLFQLTLGAIVGALFLFAYSGTCYFTLIALLASNSPKAPSMERRGYLFFVVGIVLLTLEPGLILYTVGIWIIPYLATGLWIGFLLLLGLAWNEWEGIQRGPAAVVSDPGSDPPTA
jgi:hypothetical protein